MLGLISKKILTQRCARHIPAFVMFGRFSGQTFSHKACLVAASSGSSSQKGCHKLLTNDTYHMMTQTPRASMSFFKEKVPPANHPEKGKLIYVGTVSNMVMGVKMFSLSTSLLGLCFQPILYTKAATSSLPVMFKFFMGGFVNFFIFLTPILLHFITKRYVTHMYYNENTGKFTATTLNFLVNDVETSFTREEVKIPDIAGFLTSLTVGKKALFVDPLMFLDKEAYIHLMSYDKPIDWSFKEEDLVDESPKENKP